MPPYVGVTRYSWPMRPTPTPTGSLVTAVTGRPSASVKYSGVMSAMVVAMREIRLPRPDGSVAEVEHGIDGRAWIFQRAEVAPSFPDFQGCVG